MAKIVSVAVVAMLYVWSRGGYNSARLLENSQQTRDIRRRRWTNIETTLCECPVVAVEDQWRIQRGGGALPSVQSPKNRKRPYCGRNMV